MWKAAHTSRHLKTMHQAQMLFLCLARTTWWQPKQQRGHCTSGPGTRYNVQLFLHQDFPDIPLCHIPGYFLGWPSTTLLLGILHEQAVMRDTGAAGGMIVCLLAGCCAAKMLCSGANSCNSLLPRWCLLCGRRPVRHYLSLGSALWPPAAILASSL